jgi:hypothetical protein
MSGTQDVVLVGGPRDGQLVAVDENPLLELPIDGMIHRYIRTHARRTAGGIDRLVYNYDGMVDPDGAQSGVEDAERRLASPAAHDQDD